ncbi:hypothetical protein EE612_004698 [Oryza sativa]|nr:hypothetical protein EE612_004698 [Oryza sativa]
MRNAASTPASRPHRARTGSYADARRRSTAIRFHCRPQKSFSDATASGVLNCLSRPASRTVAEASATEERTRSSVRKTWTQYRKWTAYTGSQPVCGYATKRQLRKKKLRAQGRRKSTRGGGGGDEGERLAAGGCWLRRSLMGRLAQRTNGTRGRDGCSGPMPSARRTSLLMASQVWKKVLKRRKWRELNRHGR